MSVKNYTPCNPNAQECVKNVMKFLSDIAYERIVTGQHTQNLAQEELHHIKEITGKYPALLGFELLSYSPNINYIDTDKECMDEVIDNYGTLSKAWEWADKKGLITFTWHWFSPLYGHSKSFYTQNTDFDAAKAVIEGTPENKAFVSDIDMMAGLLRPFCYRQIPILWRPFHEGDGDWFWWGAQGPDVFKKLYRIMYDRFTNLHKLDNLIWVLNAPTLECYPGDDVVDIISVDTYPPAHEHTSRSEEYHRLLKSTTTPKIMTLGEIGTHPDLKAAIDEKIGWSCYMIWSHEFCLKEYFNTNEVLIRTYDSPYAVTLENLPELY